MEFTKFSLKACCGSTVVIFKMNQALMPDFINKIQQLEPSLIEKQHFSKNGLLYMYNETFVLTGSFGKKKLNVKCRKKDCKSLLAEFEKLLNNIGKKVEETDYDQ